MQMSSAGITNPRPSGLRIYFISGLFSSSASCSGAFSRRDSTSMQAAAGSGLVITPHTPLPTISLRGAASLPRQPVVLIFTHNFDFYPAVLIFSWCFRSLRQEELPCSQHRLPSLWFYHPGLGQGCEPWQKALAYVGMEERRKKKKKKKTC